MLQKLNPREKKLVILLGIILFLFGFYKLVIEGQFAKQRELKEAIFEQELILNEKKAIAGTLDQLTREAKAVEKNLDNLLAQLRTNSVDGSREVKLGKDAKRDAVKVVLFQPLPVIQSEDYIELPIKMEIEGKYFPILDFLRSIESFYNLTEVKDLVIKKEEKKDLKVNPILKASFTFSIYTINEPEILSDYSDLSVWSVGRLNSFSVGIKAIANWNSNPNAGNNDGASGGSIGENNDGNIDGDDNSEPEILK